MSYRYFKNEACEYYPCHEVSEGKKEKFNCLFCYCPLYGKQDCGGNCVTLPNGKKDCTACTIPHLNYDYIISKL